MPKPNIVGGKKLSQDDLANSTNNSQVQEGTTSLDSSEAYAANEEDKPVPLKPISVQPLPTTFTPQAAVPPQQAPPVQQDLGNDNGTWIPTKRPYNKSYSSDEIIGGVGTASLFNKYSIFSLSQVDFRKDSLEYRSDLHYDITPETVMRELSDTNASYDDYSNIKPYESLIPDAPTIIEWAMNNDPKTSAMGPQPYDITDFVFCKHYKKIPMNQLITLRRYPFPVYDNAKTAEDSAMVPVAQMVGYFGESTGNSLKDILKMTFGAVWKEIEAKVQEVDGNEKGWGVGLEGALGGGKLNNVAGAIAAQLRGAQGRWDGSSQKEQEWLKKQWEDGGSYWNQVYGPVNVIHKTFMRDRGLNFKNDISLKFSYNLRSYKGINPKVAFLDLLSNFLMCTYSNAKFWGGATRYFPNYQDAVGFLGSQKDFYKGDYDGYFGSVQSELKSFGGQLLEGLTKMFSGGGGFEEILGSLKDAGIQAGMGKLTRQSRPQLLSIRSLLRGVPIGEWHLTIGNPMSPTAVMGNMLVDSVDMEFGEELGLDDFPTEVTFTVNLKHGRPRDSGDIESIFNLGNGRMSYAPITKLPSQQNTHGDASSKSEQAQINKRNEFAKKEKTATPEQLIDLYLTSNESKDTYRRVKERIKGEWGNQFANSKELIYLLGKTKAKF